MPSRPEPSIRLGVGGLVPFSTVDYPGHLGAVIFCQGCPWRCRYCHNPHLQPFAGAPIGWGEVEGFLRGRQGLLDAVVFSGGEPTAQPGLGAAMRATRDLGFRIALHTAGAHPDRLRQVLPLVDWVGLDIKAPFDDRYRETTGIRSSGQSSRDALRAVLDSGVDYQLRTTVHPALLDEDAKLEIQSTLMEMGAGPTIWQTFRPQGCVDAGLLA